MNQITNKMYIAAGMVLYNPESEERFTACLDSILRQVDHLYLFDNSTEPRVLVFDPKITYLTKKENKGIAYALNRIMERAEQDGFTWVLTMDQDSILPDGMLADFLNCLEKDPTVGILCPQVIDKRRAYMKADDCTGTQYVDMCITSGSCTSIQAWKDVGKFDEWLFVDLVDNDFCKRLVTSGYQILQIKNWVLDQEFGKIIPKSPKKQQFWIKISELLHNENFAKFSYKKFVNPMRVYYTCRNIIYVNKKLKKYGRTAYENYCCKGCPGFWIAFVIPSILRADRKIEVCKAVCKGTYDGLRKKTVCWDAINRGNEDS